MKRFALLLALAATLAACATAYQSDGITGGYSERERSPGVWRLVYAGNGYTTRETVQTFWLYRAAEFTLQKGYDGFEVVSANRLVSAGAGMIPVQALPDFGKPVFAADIRLLRKPIAKQPPRVFDAAELKAALEPYVKGPLCGGNVCPHVHLYLMPDLST
jgi:hypothetical protein